jgi:hypothetical protein
MRPLDLQSERYTPTGNLASQGVLNQLGRPGLDLYTVLVRETVQNSWDARLSNSEPVHFGITCRVLTDSQLELLRNVVFRHVPGDMKLSTQLSEREINALIIYDRGARGLGGPTRADISAAKGESYNFVNFLRNVGKPSGNRLSGGTFGYGKAILYLASQMHTICVHTRCQSADKLESRFIGAALDPRNGGPEQTLQGELYTGRHWWGQEKDGIVEPVYNQEADALAQGLGLPEFASNECGTTILILHPAFGQRTRKEAMQVMASSLLWYFWPKMLERENGIPSMQFELSLDGQPVLIPDPRTYPPLNGFVQALKNLDILDSDSNTGSMDSIISVESQRPKMNLGQLSLHKFLVTSRQLSDTDEEVAPVPSGELSHHVALMRQARLVVKYLPGPPLGSTHMEYAGVFITDERVDDAFARAEPPTHDDWVPTFLEDSHEKTFVRVAFSRIRNALDAFTRPAESGITDTALTPLGNFALQLGGLLPGATQSQADPAPGSPNGRTRETGSSVNQPNAGGEGTGRTTGSNKAVIHISDHGQLGIVGTAPAIKVEFKVEHAPDTQGTLIRIKAGVILDNNEMEAEPPVGSRTPQVLQWVGPDGKAYQGSQELMIPANMDGAWHVAVSVPHDSMVGMELIAQEIQ